MVGVVQCTEGARGRGGLTYERVATTMWVGSGMNEPNIVFILLLLLMMAHFLVTFVAEGGLFVVFYA